MFYVIRKSFGDYGWLLPALLPLVNFIGRAPTNILLGVYFAWGCFYLLKATGNIERKWLILFLSVIVAFGAGIFGAEDQALALKKWAHTSTRMAIFMFTLAVLNSENLAEKIRQILHLFGLCSCVILLLLYLQFAWLIRDPAFNPTFALKEDYLPFLFSFGFFWIKNARVHFVLKVACLFLFSGLLIYYIVLSNGRSALLGLVAGVVTYALWVEKWRPTKLVAGAVFLSVILVGVVGSSWFLKAASFDGSFRKVLDSFSSGRTELWVNALKEYQVPGLTGVGMGNVMYVEEAVTFREVDKVKGLHNFLLNVWFETGLIGIFCYLIFLGACFRTWIRSVGQLNAKDQAKLGVFGSASVAVMVSGFFSLSYMSLQLAFFLPLFLAIIIRGSSRKLCNARQ